MEKFKIFNVDFRPKIVPTIEGLRSEVVKQLKYPVCLQELEEGLPIVIRSGFPYLVTPTSLEKIINLSFRNKFADLFSKLRKMKITAEGVIKYPNLNSSNLEGLLTSYYDKMYVEEPTIILTDLVFEHSPNMLKYSTRLDLLNKLFTKEELLSFKGSVKITSPVVANSEDEFKNLVIFFSVTGARKFRVAAPEAKYRFGTLKEIAEYEDIVDIDTDTMYKHKLVEISPQIIKLEGKIVHLAHKLHVEYATGKTYTVDFSSNVSPIVTAKIWENRQSLLGHYVVYSGSLLPNFESPSYRTFIRFNISKL